MEIKTKTQLSILSMTGTNGFGLDLTRQTFESNRSIILKEYNVSEELDDQSSATFLPPDMGTKKKITLKNERIEYTLRKHRRAKRLKVAIYCDGNCVVTLPWHMGVLSAEQFIRKNAEWILEKMKHMKKIGKKSVFARNNHDEYLKLKEYARDFVNKKLEKFNEIYECTYKGVAIRNQKTRWGSCSAKGNLNFNYKIIFLPPRHADYIIVHELCHLKEFNHSRRFWNLVGQTIPEYKKIVEQLRIL